VLGRGRRGGGEGGQRERERGMRTEEGRGQGRGLCEDTRRARGVEGAKNSAWDATQGNAVDVCLHMPMRALHKSPRSA
jgi:hypothetical protein